MIIVFTGIGDDLNEMHNAPPADDSFEDTNSLSVNVANKQLNLFFSAFDDRVPITQTIIESKCLNFNQRNINCVLYKSALKTPLTRILSEEAGPALKKSDASKTPVNITNAQEHRSDDEMCFKTTTRTPKMRSNFQETNNFQGRACIEYIQQVCKYFSHLDSSITTVQQKIF